MKVNALYFGMIAEKRGLTKEVLEFSDSVTLATLKEKALELIPNLNDINYGIAVNQVMTTDDMDLKDGDEISFFPPFAGG
tara:strand:+ start:20541 stop:20780 length:240 start_codon:yes stop_codon:yes gene_type:complete